MSTQTEIVVCRAYLHLQSFFDRFLGERVFRSSHGCFNNNLFMVATTPRLSLTCLRNLPNIPRLHDWMNRPSLPYRSMKLVRMLAGLHCRGVSQPTPSNTSSGLGRWTWEAEVATEERWMFRNTKNFSQEASSTRKDTHDSLA